MAPPARSPGPKTSGATVIVTALLVVGTLSGCLGIERTEWAFSVTEITTLEGRGLDGEGIVVGIVDSGIDPEHPALDHAAIVAWKDYVEDRAEPYDDMGHGTHVAGIIAAQGGTKEFLSGASLTGVAPEVSLVIVKACSADTCNSDAVARGIDHAVAQGVDILTLSLGGRQVVLDLGDAPLQAVQRAVEKGVYVVVAAGNSGTQHGDVESPSSARGALAVGAVNENLNVADFSSRGSKSKNEGTPVPTGQNLGGRDDPHKKPELVAPGVDILSTWRDGTYAKATGTSQAAPFVAGAIALLLQEAPQWRTMGSKGGCSGSVDAMKSVLTQSAMKISGQTTPHDTAAGYGLLQAEAALKRLSAVSGNPCA